MDVFKERNAMDLTCFLNVEEKYNLLEKRIEDYYFWVYARTNIAWKYEKELEHLGEQHLAGKEKKRDRLKRYIRQMGYILKKGRIPRKQTDILILDHPRKVWTGKEYECIYTSEIAKSFCKTTVVEPPYEGRHFEAKDGLQYIYTDMADLKSFCHCVYVNKFKSGRFNRIKQLIVDEIRNPIMELNQLYGVILDVEKISLEIAYGFFMYEVEKKYYSRILNTCCPKVIIEVVSYSRHCMIMNELTKRKGIPSIELQHGTIGCEHRAYNFKNSEEIKQFPDYLFVFSEYWRKQADFPIPQDRIKAVGYPYLERMSKQYIGTVKEKNKINIVFLSSGPIAGEFIKIAVTLSKRLNGTKYHVIYKLHPREYSSWKEKYPELLQSDIEVVDGKGPNLYELFSKSHIQVGTYNTTTVFEGLYWGLKTYIYNYYISSEIAELCRNRYATLFTDVNELERYIKVQKGERKSVPTDLWKMNALNNMREEIKKIMDHSSNM